MLITPAFFYDTITFFLKQKQFFKTKDIRASVEKIEYVRLLMAHLNVLAYSTFKFVNSRGYDRARHSGKIVWSLTKDSLTSLVKNLRSGITHG